MSSQSTRRRTSLIAGLLGAMLVVAVLPASALSAADTPQQDAATQQAAALQRWRGNASHTFNAAAFDAAAFDASAGEVVPGSLLVTVRDDQTALQSFAAAGFTRATRLADGILKVDVDVDDVQSSVAALLSRSDVVSVEPNRIREFYAVPDDPFYPEQWAHQITGIEPAWDVTTGSTDILVAVADSGVVASHPDLAGQIVEQVDASSGEIVPGQTDNDPCKVGHGTWVSGVVGAIGNNATGIAGTNWNVSILDINTADPNVTCGGPSDAGTIAAIAYATQQGADVVNLSLGGPQAECPTAFQAVIDDAIAAGTAVIAASGNSGETTPQVPGSCNGAISVGAVGPDATVASYSTSNPYVDLAAPGGAGAAEPSVATEILTTSYWATGERTDEYAILTGTSFAAPYVSGLAALMRAVNPDLTVAQIESLLESTALDIDAEGRDDRSGWGLVQGAAVTATALGGDIPAPQPDPDFPVEGGSTPPPPPPPSEGNRPGGDVTVGRVSTGEIPTEPITQAVAVSQSVFGDADSFTQDQPAALWGVVARQDDYADALAGSSLTLGAAPLLFTNNSGPLAAPTAAELTRTLQPGSTVYLLGGSAALPATLDAEITALGFAPVRLAGPVRENTAVAIADEVDRLLVEVVGLPPSPVVLLVNRDNWPDAVAAGQLGAQFGYPILLTPPDALAAPTAEALAARNVEQLIVVGGTVRVSETTMKDAADLTQVAEAIRLAGEERNGTVVAVSAAVEQILAGTELGRPANALVVNVRRDDAYAHMLSATVPVAAFTGVFIPVEEDDGSRITQPAIDYTTGLGLPLALMGGPDLIVDATGLELERLSEITP